MFARPPWRLSCTKLWPSLPLQQFDLLPLGRRSRRLPPLPRVLRCVYPRFGAALQQEQPGDSVRPIAYIGRATLDPERHWTSLDLEADIIGWAIKRLRGYLWGTKFRIFSDQKALESIGKVGDHNARVQRWLEFFTAFDYTLEYRKDGANGNPDFLSRLLDPATEHGRSGSSSLTPVNGSSVFLIRACGLRTRSSPPPVLVWVGWCPAPRTRFWLGSLSPRRIFANFAHMGHVRGLTTFLPLLGDSSLVYLPPSPRPTAVPAMEKNYLPPTPLSLRFLPCPLRAARALQKPPLRRWLSPSMFLHREPIPPRSLIRLRPPFHRLATRRPR